MIHAAVAAVGVMLLGSTSAQAALGQLDPFTELNEVAGSLSLPAFTPLLAFSASTNTSGVANTFAQQLAVGTSYDSIDNAVTFYFVNDNDFSGSIYGRVTNLYFAFPTDPPPGLFETPLVQSDITDSDGAGTGVRFLADTTPDDPNIVNFDTEEEAQTDYTSQGLNEDNEWVGVRFALAGGNDFGDVLAALDSGDLQIAVRAKKLGGCHCGEDYFEIAYSGGGSGGDIPEPATLLIFGAGIAGAATARRRRRRS